MDNQIDVSNPLAAPQVPLPAALDPSQNGTQNPLAVSTPVASGAPGTPAAPSAPGQSFTPQPAAQPATQNPMTPAKAAPAAAPAAPGSFAQKLLQAIGGVLSAAQSTGQVVAAKDPQAELVRQQQAALEQKKYQAEQARLAQERQDKLTEEQQIQKRADDESAARIAETNVRTVAARSADYRQGQDYMQKQVARGQADLKSMEGAEVPAEVIQSGIDGGQINALLQQGKINTHQYTVIPTGLKTTGVDENGNAKSDYVYDVVKVPDKWTPTDDQVARIQTVPGYEKFQKGTDMTGAQVLSALSQADTIKTTHDTMMKAREDADLAAFTEQQKADSAAFTKSGDWLRFLNTYHGDPVMAAQHILQDPTMSKKYSTSLYKDVMGQFATEKDPTGVSGYSTMLHQWQEDANNRLKIVTNNEGAGTGMIGGSAMTDRMKANIAGLPKDKQAVVNRYDAPTQASLYSVAFGPGDVSIDAFPNRVSGKSGQLDRAHAEGVIRQLNPNWSEQQYKQTQAAYKQVTFGRNGQDVETYNNLLDHMSNAQDVIEDSLRANNPKFLNSAINLAETQGWGTEAAKIQTALEPVKSEFESLMNNGHALHADQSALYNAIINPAETPAQLEAAFKNFGATGAVRLLGLNDQYMKIAGQKLPGILRKETMESAKHLNLDPKTMQELGSLNSGDTLFHNPNWTPGTPEEQQQSVDTQQQQQQAGAQAAQATAQQLISSGKSPQGYTGIALNKADGSWHWHDGQMKDLGRVQ